ncbi:PREDICTED: uncharacterized protein LOC109230568 [Nicotiana attenuata]|uniref:Uncharacterized protein n=1 Tax=Nicotiana attenuata TaxID=49451 RepID=A0A1J6J174_NICAT|nr:PREDICTED: uncharacterized protein LOC109230568 [Nicotiana attenuata]OIT01057.1 hypothetical protein A4A49_13875 [Nicotiana attenuata]
MFRKVLFCIDAVVEIISKPLVFGLRKGEDMNPKFEEMLVKAGQRLHFGNTPLPKENAIQYTGEAFVCVTMVGTAIVYQWSRSRERQDKELLEYLKQERWRKEQEFFKERKQKLVEENQKLHQELTMLEEKYLMLRRGVQSEAVDGEK